MPTVKFLNENVTIHAEKGTTILEAARQAGVTIESPCNGTGVCGKCKVKLKELSGISIQYGKGHRLSEEEEREGYVLACETRIISDIEVLTVQNPNGESMIILDHGKSFDIQLDRYIKKEYLGTEGKTAVYGNGKLLGIETGDTSGECYGLVVDIGTTTLVMSVVDLITGAEIDSISALNPQAIHAQDVLSRIRLASDEKGLDLLYTDLVKELNKMIEDLVRRNHIHARYIYEAVYSGNTCMLHLAANENPYTLGKYPYTPVIRGGIHLRASEYGLKISEFGVIYLPPIISAYVGADITSGILAAQLNRNKGVTLFIDIGTNGEMLISLDGELSATSTAAGPAFEGMNITHGMRAGIGAIEYFKIEHDGRIIIKTIGNVKAKGICGSGILDIVGELVSFGVIDRNGRFADPETADILPSLKKRLVKQDGRTIFKITDSVVLTQKDVRQVQLAKGAVRAGIEFLLNSREIDASRVQKVLIAGSFGYHLQAGSLINIGLLPAEFDGRIEFIGNTSKSGGHAFLINKSYRSQMNQIVKKVEVIELADFNDFDKVFVKCMNF